MPGDVERIKELKPDGATTKPCIVDLTTERLVQFGSQHLELERDLSVIRVGRCQTPAEDRSCRSYAKWFVEWLGADFDPAGQR